MNRKRILHIVQSAGGVASYLSMFFRHMNRDNFSNILICSKDYSFKEFEPLVDHLEYLEMEREISFTKDIKDVFLLRTLIKKYDPHIIYFHSSKAGAIGRIAALGLKKKLVYNAHGWAFNMNISSLKKSTYKIIERILAIITDKIVAISKFEKESALKYNICSDNKVVVINNGIDLELILKKKESRCHLKIPHNAYIIGMVGRISEQKAPDIFIKAASIIANTIPNSFFIIVGDGPDRNNIELLIKQLELENRTMITGWIDNPIECIHLFDQAILLSRWEGFGLVLAEYMACSKPIVATLVDAIPDLIQNNTNGLLVLPDDYEAAAAAIITLYENKEICEKFTNEGLKIVEKKFNIKRVVEEHISLFNNLLNVSSI